MGQALKSQDFVQENQQLDRVSSCDQVPGEGDGGNGPLGCSRAICMIFFPLCVLLMMLHSAVVKAD